MKDADPEQPAVVRGLQYEVQLGSKRNERTITNPYRAFNLLRKLLGIKGVVALIDIPLGAAIDKHIPKSQQKPFVVEERTGWRALKVVALLPDEAA